MAFANFPIPVFLRGAGIVGDAKAHWRGEKIEPMLQVRGT